MRTIFLCEDAAMLQRVYGTEERVFCKADILGCESFCDVEYVFSTWGMPGFSEEEIRAHFPALKAVLYAAGSVQAFARPFLNCGVRVFSAWAANAVPVAEYTVAQIVLANKGFFKTMRFADKSAAREVFDRFCGNYNVKIGIIGVGMIGKLVIQKLKAYQLDVLVFDPFLSDAQAAELGVTKADLKTLFEQCCVVSNHLADNEQTRGMLDGALFATMLPYATFLNTGRGAQVVEAELVQVLKQRPDLTAILDVTHPEPPVQGSELYTLENCILTPHIAGSSGNEVWRMADYMRAEYERLQRCETVQYEVTMDMLSRMA